MMRSQSERRNRSFDFTKRNGILFAFACAAVLTFQFGISMKQLQPQTLLWRATGAVVTASFLVPLAGCGAPAQQTSTSTQTQMRPQTQTRQQNPGMSTRQKATLLAGAAAMYFLWRKYQRDNQAKLQQVQAASPNGKIQFYRSRKGGYIYYRDPRNPQVAIKIPGTERGVEGVQQQQVYGNEAQEYQKFQGYNNQQTGETLDRYFPVQ